MRRVDYIAVAKAIRDSGAGKNQRTMVVDSIIRNLKVLHPLMDVDSFRAMANVEDHKDRKINYLMEKYFDEKDKTDEV